MYGYSIPNVSPSTNLAFMNHHFYIHRDPRLRTYCTEPCGTKSRLDLMITALTYWVTGTGTIIPAYPLSPSTFHLDFSCGQLTKFA